MKKKSQHPEEMSLEELAEFTREFYEPNVFEKARPMTPRERAEERKLRRAQPRDSKGARKVSISLEGQLLKRTDAMAKRRGLNRSELIADFIAAGLRGRAG